MLSLQSSCNTHIILDTYIPYVAAAIRQYLPHIEFILQIDVEIEIYCVLLKQTRKGLFHVNSKHIPTYEI